MKIFGINFTTKKELKKRVANLESALKYATKLSEEVIGYNEDIGVALEDMMKTFPLTLGETVYDIQLRGENGKFTKTKASRQHSLINEVVVDEKNYFKLVKRMKEEDVFLSLEDAQAKLDNVCVK